MRKAGEPCRNTPGFPDPDQIMLRIKLIREEAGKELVDGLLDGDMQEIVDGIGDSLYVIFGTAVAYGLDAQAIFDRVHASNMTKFIDGHKDPATGKWIKGPSFVPPDFTGLI